MAGLVEANEARFAPLEALVQDIARILQVTYIRGEITQNPRHATSPFPARLWALTPHAAGIHMPFDQIDLACMATISTKTFFAYVSETLELDEEIKPVQECLAFNVQDAKSLQSSNYAAEICKTKIVIRYQLQPQDLPKDSVILLGKHTATHTDSANQCMARIYDTQMLLQAMYGSDDDVDSREMQNAYRLRAYLRLHQWAGNVGILGAEFGMLTTACLLRMFVTALSEFNLAPTDDDDAILRRIIAGGSFFEIFQRVEQPSAGHPCRIVRSPSGNNEAQNVSFQGSRAVEGALNHLSRKLWMEDELDLVPTRQAGFQNFLDESQNIVRLTSRCWDIKHYDSFLKWMLVVLEQFQDEVMNRVGTECCVRVWPYPVAKIGEESSDDLIYLFDIYDDDTTRGTTSKDNLIHLLESVSSSLKYNRESMYIEIDTAAGSDFSLRDTDMAASSAGDNLSLGEEACRRINASLSRFRTAASAMNRLRWDDSHRKLDYEVGYVDRFEVDLIWKSLDKWERFTEEEEFVPEHRIRQIRRTNDKCIVWDREKRFDGTDGRHV